MLPSDGGPVYHSQPAEVSISETGWDEKVAAYHELGVEELVRFDPEADEGCRLRAWDRVDEDLTERVVTADRTICRTLGGGWFVGPSPVDAVTLRLADELGNPWLAEVEAQGEQLQSQAARIRELEDLLRRKK